MKSIALVALSACMLAACSAQPTIPAKPAGTTTDVTVGKPGKPADDADQQQVLAGVKMIQAGQIMAAIDGPLNGVVNKYEAQYGRNPKNIYSARGVGDTLLYAAKGATEKRNVVVLGPAWAMAYWARGYAYSEMARYDDARVELEKALALAPNDAQYNNELAFILVQKHDWNNALARYQDGEAFAELTARDAAPHVKCVSLRGEGYVLVELHRLDDAEAKYRECLTIIPNEPKSLGEIGYIEKQKGKQAQSH